MKRLNIFVQDWAFGHRVAFKRLLAATIDQRWSAQEGCSVTGWCSVGGHVYPAPVLALSSHSLGGPWFSENNSPPTLKLLWEGPTLGGCGWSRERERERERLGDDDDDLLLLLLRGGEGGGGGGLRRQEYAAWAVWTAKQSPGALSKKEEDLYRNQLIFFFPQLHDRSPNVKRHATQ